MKKIIAITAVVLVLGAVGGWIYWQQNKKRIIRNMIENKVAQGTDSLYFIHYDSSSIDEMAGNAAFYNISLQSDSLKQQLQRFDTASAESIYNVHIDELSASGVNTAALLNNTAITADEIRIIRPVIYVVEGGKKEEKPMTFSGHESLYRKMLGKYENIHAERISIENGSIFFTDKNGTPHTSLTGINIQFSNFGINSSKDYQNIPSYFIKDVVAKVKEVSFRGKNRKSVITDIEYNAPKKFIKLKNFRQTDDRNQLIHDINNTYISNIATDSFILRQQLKAGELISEGGTITFFITRNNTTANDQVEMDANYFDEALLNKIKLGKTRIIIVNTSAPAKPPLVISNVIFEAYDIQKVYSGTSLKNVVGRSNWTVSGDGFSLLTDNKRYQLKAGAFSINKEKGIMNISKFAVIPQIGEEAFARSVQYQDDLYHLEFNNISLTGMNAGLLITQRRLEAATVSLQPVLRIFNDRTVAPNPESKVGKYPHQLLQKVKFPIHIKKMIVNNGSMHYKERGFLSKQTGTVFFKNINATITNVTNIKELVAQNNVLELNATARFMDISSVNTNWKLKLNDPKGSFNVSGTFGAFNAVNMNPVTEPLGMVSIKKGTVNKLTFNLDGTDYKAQGTSTILYNDLKISVLKRDPEVERAGVRSFLANVFIKDSNPKNGEQRSSDVLFERDIHKSFFNLVWQAIFAATKKTASKL